MFPKIKAAEVDIVTFAKALAKLTQINAPTDATSKDVHLCEGLSRNSLRSSVMLKRLLDKVRTLRTMNKPVHIWPVSQPSLWNFKLHDF